MYVEDGEMVVLPLLKGGEQQQARVIVPSSSEGSFIIDWKTDEPVHLEENGALVSEDGIRFLTVQFPRNEGVEEKPQLSEPTK